VTVAISMSETHNMGYRIVCLELLEPPTTSERALLDQVVAVATFHGLQTFVEEPTDYPGKWDLTIEGNSVVCGSCGPVADGSPAVRVAIHSYVSRFLPGPFRGRSHPYGDRALGLHPVLKIDPTTGPSVRTARSRSEVVTSTAGSARGPTPLGGEDDRAEDRGGARPALVISFSIGNGGAWLG
jgi:hypothetical protein